MATTADVTTDRRTTHRFGMWDTNSNGVLTEGDFLHVARGIPAAYGAAEDSPKGKPVVDGIRAFWARHLEGMDLDADGQISLEEYRAGAERNIRRNDGVEPVVVPFWQAVLDLADESGNGPLDVAELVRGLGAFGVSEADARYTFGGIDADRNGEITLDEWLEALRQFWSSTDPDAPRNTPFGRH